MAGLTIERVGAAAEVRRAGWDFLPGQGDFYLTTDWLMLLETLRTGRPTYLLGRDAASGRLVAGLACYRLDATSTPSQYTRLDRFLLTRASASARPEDAAPLLPTLLCGGRQIGLSRVLTARLEPERRAERVRRMIATAEELARSQGARSLAFLYVEHADAVLRAALSAAGYRQVQSHDHHVLEAGWAEFEGYLATLSGHRRTTVRRERRRLLDAGVEVSARRLAEADVPALVDLEANLVARHGSARSRVQLAATLEAVARRLADRSLLVLASHGGVPRAFALFLRWRDELYARHTGFDYAFQGKLPLYFEVLFYEIAARAPALGLSRIHYGVATGRAKLSRGCLPVPELAYVRPLDDEAAVALAALTTGPAERSVTPPWTDRPLQEIQRLEGEQPDDR